MALDTYAGLRASVAGHLNRQDLTAAIPDFITLFEAAANRELRVLQMETLATGTSDEGNVPVPTDWLETRTFRLSAPATGSPVLEYVGEEEWDDLQRRSLTGTTRFYTIINGEFQVLPTPSSSIDYTLRYYAKIPALSDAATSNWLLAKSPDLYLYGSLLAAEAYMKDDDRLAIWAAARQKIISDMMLESERAKRSATRLVAKRQTFG